MTALGSKPDDQAIVAETAPTPSRQILFFWLSVTGVACAIAYHAFLELFTSVASFDDPGYMLSLINAFNEHGQLYQKIFSQYGPFYSEIYYLIGRVLGVPVTHDGIRWVVLVLWVFSSIAGAILAFRLTGRIGIALIWQLLCCHVLILLGAEPGHPISLITASFGVIILLLDGRLSAQPRFWQALMLGASLGVLLMIKINLGLFAVAALGTAWIYHSPLDTFGKVARGAAAFLMCVPLLLIRTGWPVETGICFTILFISSLLSVLASAGYQTIDWKILLRSGSVILAGLLLTCTLSILIALLTGSRWTDLIEGTIVGPMRLGSIFAFSPAIGPLPAFTAIVGLLIAITWRFFCRMFLIDEGRFAFGLRLFFLTLVIVWVAIFGYYFSWVLPFLWIAALPLDSEAPNSNGARWRLAQMSLALLAVGQVLGVYPVAGTQCTVPVYLGSACALFAFAGLLVDLRGCAGNSLVLRVIPKAVVNIGFPIVLIGLLGQEVHRAADRYDRSFSLDLPGARLLRIEELSAATYRFLAANLRESRPSFLTLPGLNSLYGWSQREPPTGFNTGMNFALLSPDQQRAMVNVGRTCRPIAAVLNRELLAFWIGGKSPPSTPLIDFVMGECRSIGRVNKFEVMILRDSPPPVLNSCVTIDKEWQPGAPDNQITVYPPASFGRITSASLLDASFKRDTSHLMEAILPSDYLKKTQNLPIAGPNQFSLPLNAPVPTADSLDQMLIQLTDETARTVNLPFLRPPQRPLPR